MALSTDEITSTFADLELCEELSRALSELGYEEPTPIQREAIPPMLAGHDLMGQAATGTGKTAAFALPILERIAKSAARNLPKALVLVPTRELAIQVSEAIHRYGAYLKVRVLPIYGGQPIGRQLNSLSRGVDVVVATPGRALDHIARGTLRLDGLEIVVLDEADEMLDMGFAEDIEAILKDTPEGRQTVLFSATMPPRVDRIARRYLDNPKQIRLAAEVPTGGETARVRQSAYLVARSHKPAALGRILDVESPSAAVVFCRTRAEVEQLTESLNGRGYSAEALHGGMDQNQRDRVMGRVRNGTTDLLVATDVAARGLDIDHLTHVVNYDVPSAPDSYVHRIGRVGRAGREGVAITLAEPREHRLLQAIERVTKQQISIEQLPSIADLRVKKLEATRAALYECLTGGDLDQFRVVVETLTDEFDLMDVATAAVKMAYDVSGAASSEEEIPDLALRTKTDNSRRDGSRDRQRDGSFKKDGRSKKDASLKRDGGFKKEGNFKKDGGFKKDAKHKKHSDGDSRRDDDRSRAMTRLYVGAGHNDGIRPQDLVGAIAGESRLSGRDIGAIDITDRFSLVEIPDGAVDEVIFALKRTTIKGKRANVRRER